MRSAKTISEAENEFNDRVWYNRKLVMLEHMREGTESVDEDVMDKVTDAMRKCEEKYGGAENLMYDDFEWGMINGKLSALRWVLGEDWDDLDT